MVWKKLFPTQGGGSLRRWIRMRKDLFEIGMNQSLQNQKAEIKSGSSSSTITQPDLPMKPLTMFDFSRSDDAADARAVHVGSKLQGWRISDDEVLGGYSRATFDIIGVSADADADADIDDENSKVDQDRALENEMASPFIRWQGNIDTRISPDSRAKRSGFCAIRCPQFPFGGIPLGDKYNALEVRCRTDGRAYTVNLKVQTYFPDDLYQSMITVKSKEVEEIKSTKRLSESDQPLSSSSSDDDKDGFISIILPFQDFLLTSHGMPKSQQRTLDSLQLQHLGLTLMDGVDGPFTFDLKRIRLVNYSYRDGVIVNDYGENEDGIDGDENED